MLRINRHIKAANERLPNGTVAEKLESAWSANVREREVDAASSVDLVGRDSDHYFAGRRATSLVGDAIGGSKAAKIVTAAGGQLVNLGYDGLKLISEAQEKLSGSPGFMRSDKRLPAAPVGGTRWFTRGEKDAFGDESSSHSALALCRYD
ncbi:MAG: hypothetical protein JO290_10215 [Sphingomonadaceae bacterium]|nr:hypothetical protein [Sphingomonadaceae bacterium]